jgi:hypothetical protein
MARASADLRAKPSWSTKGGLFGQSEESKIRRIFESLDSDGDNMVNFDELIAGLKNHKNLARLLDMKDSEDLEELRQIFDGIDEDGNGELDFEEFGLFFASRVEYLRYLPEEGGDEAYLVLTDTFLEIVEKKLPSIVSTFKAGLKTAALPVITPLIADMTNGLRAFVEAFLDPADLIADLKARGYSYAPKGADKALFDRYGVELLVAIEASMPGGKWPEKAADAWLQCMDNYVDIMKLGVDEYTRANAEKAAEAAKAAKIEAFNLWEAAQAEREDKEKKRIAKEQMEKAAKLAEEVEEEKARLAKEVEEAKKKQAAEDEKKAKAREKAEKEKAEADKKKSDAEKAQEAIAEAEQKAKVEAAKARFAKEGLSDKTPGCGCVVQ